MNKKVILVIVGSVILGWLIFAGINYFLYSSRINAAVDAQQEAIYKLHKRDSIYDSKKH